MKGVVLLSVLFLLVGEIKFHQCRKIDEDIVYQHQAAVRQRLSEIRQVLLPLPEDQWDHILRHFASFQVPINSCSNICRNHSQHLLQSFLVQEIWALRMIDASSKFQSGVLDGHLHNMGSYEQCVSVEEPSGLFRGQHCVIETTGVLPSEISDIVYRKGFPLIGDDGLFSLCVPSTCSDHDVYTHVDLVMATLGVRSKHYLEDLGLSTDIRKVSCSTAGGVPFRTKDYFAITVFASLILIVLIATLTGANTGCLSYFSLSKNFQELMDTRTSPDDISCLTGLRILMILQIIVGHRMIAWLLPHNRPLTQAKAFGTLAMDAMEAFLPKAVDSFFLLGGLVLSYSFLMKTKRREDFNFLSFVIKRYFRLTPVLAVIALYEATLLIHSSHGPLWLRNMAEVEDRCYLYWWCSLFHINNLVVPSPTCVGPSWYTAADFQLYCFAPIVLLLLLRRPRLGLTIIFLCILLSTGATMFAAYYFQLSSGYAVSIVLWDRLTDLHIRILSTATFFRASPFLMGLALGYLMFYAKKVKGPVVLSKRTAWVGWISTAAAMVTFFLVNKHIVSPEHQYTNHLDPMFLTLSRPIFCCCLSWLIFACHFGCGGHVNAFLSWSGFHVLSKLVVSVFLVHQSIQMIQLYSLQRAVILSYIDQIFFSLGDIVASFAVAVVLHTVIEMPFYKLSIFIIKDLETRSKKKKQND